MWESGVYVTSASAGRNSLAKNARSDPPKNGQAKQNTHEQYPSIGSVSYPISSAYRIIAAAESAEKCSKNRKVRCVGMEGNHSSNGWRSIGAYNAHRPKLYDLLGRVDAHEATWSFFPPHRSRPRWHSLSCTQFAF